MKKYFFPTLIILVTCLSVSFAQDADDILSKMDDIMFSPKDKQGEVRITLIAKSGKEKIRVAAMYQKGANKRLYRYTEPESQAGIATLSLPEDIMWLYMPAFGKPKKISFLAKSQAFTGTDFSYEDMASTPYADRYTPKLVESEGENYVLELTPISNKSHYSKLLVTLHKTHGYPILMEYFNKGGNKFKEATYKYQKIGEYWNAEELVMTNLKKKHTTKIELFNIKFDQGLTDTMFLVENLKLEEEGNN